MSTINIDGENISYSISRNVSLNRANPHRLMAFCPECKELFMRMGVSNSVFKEKNMRKWISKSLKRHREEGYCKFHPVEHIAEPVVKPVIINNPPIQPSQPHDPKRWEERFSW